MSTSLLTKQQLSEKLKISPRSIDRKIEAGEFPRGIKLGSWSVRWPESQIDSWIAEGCPSVDPRSK